ncbi:gas vesicle protein [Egibacter rhizosphaerae]|uniref:Gas vesicle protein n=2 Tax=Egibacter rhizosphaerae TaxID=1670831 RepID=A0A411YL25_9ACTN|nr:gas vesicle protein [Egibacter rhizosphaerae]
MRGSPPTARRSSGPDGLADVLERILDKGLVVAGDIQVNLLDIELITIKVRLLLASADTAQQMGIDWWKHDPFLSGRDRELAQENAILRDRVDALEARLGEKLAPGEPSPSDLVGEGATDRTSTRGQTRPTEALRREARQAASPGSDTSERGRRREEDPSTARPDAVETEEIRVEPAQEGSTLRIETDEAQGEDAIATSGDARIRAEDASEGERYAELSKAQLQSRLRERGLPVSGNKDALIERLRTSSD